MDYDNYVGDSKGITKRLGSDELAKRAVDIACMQLMTSTEFKKPRMERLERYWKLYNGDVKKKLRQLFNVPIPVFPGMIDTLNAQYDTPVSLDFKEGDASDYFKVQKINGAWQMEVMDTAENTKWDTKLRMARKHAIMNGRAILKYHAESDPEYRSHLDVVSLKKFHFQPRGGVGLENHLFAGEEGIEKTEADLKRGAESGAYDKAQVTELLANSARTDYLPNDNPTHGQKLERFKPFGLNPDMHTYVGQSVFNLAHWILELDGVRWYLCFHPWSKTYLRFDKWEEICSSDLYPWITYATHEDDENFLSKAYADDLYPSADAVVAMFNQELTNREKRNFGARAYDKDMFTDVRKLDESMHRPDSLVPADTKGGTRRIAEGIYEFKVAELGGTINLIDWIQDSLGRNTGANDLSMGSVQEVSKKASVTFAEQKAVSKRLSWGAQPFQEMMAQLGKRYIYGLKDHMPAKMAIRILGEHGHEWDMITRLDLDTKKDVDIIIESTDKQMQESELRSQKRKEALVAIKDDPNVNSQWVTEEILKSVGGYDDVEVAVAMDVNTHSNKKSLAHAADAIQRILRGQKPQMWWGADTAFMQKIVDFAVDNRDTLKNKYNTLIQYAMSHGQIVQNNIERKAQRDARNQALQQQMMGGGALAPAPVGPPVQQSVEPPVRDAIPAGVQNAITRGNEVPV